MTEQITVAQRAERLAVDEGIAFNEALVRILTPGVQS
jgi:hypothetical protein